MKLKPVITVIFIALLVAACSPSPASEGQGPTPDIAAVRTSAASTVVSQFTLTAAAFTPTASLPTETPATQAGITATATGADRKSTRLNSSHLVISYAVFCLK